MNNNPFFAGMDYSDDYYKALAGAFDKCFGNIEEEENEEPNSPEEVRYWGYNKK